MVGRTKCAPGYKKLKLELEEQILKPYESTADVLLVHDDKSLYYTGNSRKHSGLAHWVNNWIPVAIFKSSVSHDPIHLDDLSKVNLAQYKAVVFVNTFVPTAEQRKFIKNTVAKEKRHLVFVYAPGYCDGKALSVDNISDIVGINLSKVIPASQVSLSLDSTIVDDNTFSLNKNVLTTLLFVVNDINASAYGKLTNTTTVGLAFKEKKESTSWFLSLPSDNVKLWRFILTRAGDSFLFRFRSNHLFKAWRLKYTF